MNHRACSTRRLDAGPPEDTLTKTDQGWSGTAGDRVHHGRPSRSLRAHGSGPVRLGASAGRSIGDRAESVVGRSSEFAGPMSSSHRFQRRGMPRRHGCRIACPDRSPPRPRHADRRTSRPAWHLPDHPRIRKRRVTTATNPGSGAGAVRRRQPLGSRCWPGCGRRSFRCRGIDSTCSPRRMDPGWGGVVAVVVVVVVVVVGRGAVDFSRRGVGGWPTSTPMRVWRRSRRRRRRTTRSRRATRPQAWRSRARRRRHGHRRHDRCPRRGSPSAGRSSWMGMPILTPTRRMGSMIDSVAGWSSRRSTNSSAMPLGG